MPVICDGCHLPSQNYHFAMVRRTYESDAAKIEDVDDLDDLVVDNVKHGGQPLTRQDVDSVGIRSV